jgi:hypothetical protein
MSGLGAAGVTAPDAWRPWRSYATHHLWATLEGPPGPVATATLAG